MALLVEKLLGESRDSDPVERWMLLREVLQETAKLRRGDHHAARLDRESMPVKPSPA